MTDMTDDEVFDAVKKTLADVRMDRPVAAIEERGRQRRRNRGLLGVAAGVGLAAVAGVAVAIPLLSHDDPPATAGPATGPSGVQSTEAPAFTLVANADGSVRLTLDYKKILDPPTLEKALAGAGIPAVVKADVLCTPQGQELPETKQVFAVKKVVEDEGSRYDLVITPSKMPAGSVVYFSVFPVHKGEGYAKAAQFLVPKDAQMNCRTVA
ncbi:hypothetical protein [Dactylosporangium sp. NPDC051541]|uniref:hypothetical protein n=1 Tax=Dactylosporangium sp. NPDC051541 TaxID=3363977 RepID=UPI0037B57286